MRGAVGGVCAGVGDGGVTGATDYGALLESLCDPNDTYGISGRPWRVSVGEEEFAAATNGKRALYLDGARLAGYYKLQSATNPLSDLLASVPSPTHEVGRDALLAAVGLGDPLTDKPEEERCQRCGGTGEIMCDLDHFHDCPDCGGTGTWKSGGLKRSDDPRDIDTWRLDGVPSPFDARLARGVIEHLPGDPILVSGDHKMVAFRGEGWVFVIAGVVHASSPCCYIATTPILRAKPEVAG